MSYHLTGVVSVIVFGLCLLGIGSQLHLIRHRRRRSAGRPLGAEQATDNLSLNQFASSFLAFFSFFVYGFVIEPFNHYLVWPRLLATLLTLVVLYEIMIDRREARALSVFIACVAATAVALGFLIAGRKVWGHPLLGHSRSLSQALVVVSALIVTQGYAHQVAVIRRTGRTGGVALRMHQLTLLKDVSTVLFGLAMGWKTGWPLLLMNGLCAVTKLGVMWQFHWVRVSPVAQQLRAQPAGGATAPSLLPFD